MRRPNSGVAVAVPKLAHARCVTLFRDALLWAFCALTAKQLKAGVERSVGSICRNWVRATVFPFG